MQRLVRHHDRVLVRCLRGHLLNLVSLSYPPLLHLRPSLCLVPASLEFSYHRCDHFRWLRLQRWKALQMIGLGMAPMMRAEVLVMHPLLFCYAYLASRLECWCLGYALLSNLIGLDLGSALVVVV